MATITATTITCCQPWNIFGSKKPKIVLELSMPLISEAKILPLAKPNNNKAIEPDAVMVIIPLNSLGILSTRFRNPVIKPHTPPASIPTNVAIRGGTFLVIIKAQAAPPINKLPSAVISAKSSILNVKNTPRANRQHGRPMLNVKRISSVISMFI